MPCHTRMKTILSQGFLWLCLLSFGFVLCVIEPGYLDFDNLPDTNFSCVGKVIGGYYADLETSCQMFHVCTIGQLDEPMDIRFLCLNGTVFDQETRVCERVDEVDCTKSERFYHLNLELYGNTAPPIVEEPTNTDPPPSTTSTTTPRSSSTSRTTRATFYTTAGPTAPPPTHSTPKVITSNQFPIHSGPDIRFNPEEINIRLTPGSPPIIKSPGVSFQQQTFNGEGRIQVTTHSYKQDITSQKPVTTTQKPKSVVSYGLKHTKNYQNPHSYDYSYQNTENTDLDYHTDLPSGEYYDHMNYESTNQKKVQVISTTTTRRPYISTTKPTLQLPVPLFPTLPPLIFSSPAPFTLSRHIETKRSNDQHRPRIVVSASASVSDASGRRLNYSLGTIGQHILPKAPHSYDEYKEADVGLDPFYHDVPKVNKPRRKRSIEEENSAIEVTSTEDVERTTHWTPPDYVDDNYEPLTYNISDNTNDTTKVEEQSTKTPEKPTEKEYEYYEYVDDNYEPSVYENNDNKTKDADPILTTTENTTPSEVVTQETTIESNTITESLNNIQRDTTELPTTVVDDLTTTVQPEIQETTTYPETTTTEQPYSDNMDTITTTEPVTISSDTLQYTITTPQSVTEVVTETTTPDLENTTPGVENTTPGVENTTPYLETITPDQERTSFNLENTTPYVSNQETTTEVTTPNNIESTTNIFTTELPETTLNLDNSQEITTESLAKETTTEVLTSSSTTRYQYLRTREPAYKRFSRNKPTTRHRFSSPTIHMSQSVLKLRGSKFANPQKSYSSSEEIRSEVISHRLNNILPESNLLSTTIIYDDVPVTDATLSKSANPTEPKNTKNHLSTTPITKTTFFIPRRFTYDVMKSFNCFGKQLNKFYEDPRDCRLFHYCTPGYSDTQVLDMKFVCDYGTYFDSDKLICTKIKPQRCK